MTIDASRWLPRAVRSRIAERGAEPHVDGMPSQTDLLALYGDNFAHQFASRERDSRRIDRILRYCDVRPTDRLLDLGCAHGLLLDRLKGRIGSYVGVDFSEAVIAAGRARHPEASFVRADLTEFCAAHPGEFDSAFALDLSEHVPDDDWLRILRAVRVALVPDGRLFLHTPNAGFLLERLKHWGILRQFPEHVAVRDLAGNVALIEGAGFRIAQARHISHYNVLRYIHPLSRVPRIGPWFQARVLIEARS